ncbi:carbon starvation protein A [Phragmitibacter flavus]|uniref:Carbon starvation protein A n=1 Tax=Phragmitibacter flavus TaxID=2576071 RepID=A0A5R8KIF4_9BACT|nr:carbon starvation protein A [Phragmitibacter flavus]TLD72030.1 carbon starvation protein A [Phragmitibacter flavus]
MSTLLIALGSIVLYLIAYNTYGRWLGGKIFKLDAKAKVPSEEMRDDVDYVPTSKSIVFGHHFTSIAGTGPIVGPALAIMWGWVPALLWVLFGSIFIGAVHDFGTLVVSMRNRGMTVGQVAGRLINRRVRLLFLVLLFFALWLVLAIFGWVIASVFVQFPASILPVFLQIPIAIWIGVKVHRKGGNLLWPSIIALTLMYLTVWLGAGCPGMEWTGGTLGAAIQSLNATLAAWPIWVWVAILLAYCYAASVMPVWILLQPRDYINSLQLISSLALIVGGLLIAAFFGFPATVASEGAAATRMPLEIVAPALNMSPLHAPPIFPFLFVTIACGAVSGFHCLVSSGTSSKQLKSETDAKFVGYGSMLLEGFLAVLVILAVGAGIGFGWPSAFPGASGTALWNQAYADWTMVTGGKAIGAFVVGSSNFVQTLGIDATMATALMGVLVASFAGTTLDSATRLQRYVIQELADLFEPTQEAAAKAAATGQSAGWNPLGLLRGTHGATMFAVITAFGLALFPGPGKPWSWDTIGTGGLVLWPLFGATNQLMAGLALMVVAFWLIRRGIPSWLASLPMIFMLIMPAWALFIDINKWLNGGSYLLVIFGLITITVEIWMVIEAFLLWPKVRGVLEEPLPALAPKTA